MKNFIATLLLVPSICFGGVIASMPNQAGGKIVLTDEDCVHNGQRYAKLYKSYFYIPQGMTGYGCWAIEDGSDAVTVVWIDSGNTKRYPIQNFDIRK